MTKPRLVQENTVQDLIALLQPNKNVRAVYLFGSCACSGVQRDVWSDVDVLVIVDERAMGDFYPTVDWLESLGEPYAYEQNTSEFTNTTRVCYTDFRRVDFVFTTESALEQIEAWPLVAFWQGTRLLFSRSSLVDEILARSFEHPKPPLTSSEQFQTMVNRFWFKGQAAITKVVRNDLLIALHLALEMVQDCCVLGMLLRDRSAGTSHHREGGIGNLVVDQLQATQFPYTAAGILDSIEQTSITFDSLASQWSDDYREHRHPLLGWLEDARETVMEREAQKNPIASALLNVTLPSKRSKSI